MSSFVLFGGTTWSLSFSSQQWLPNDQPRAARGAGRGKDVWKFGSSSIWAPAMRFFKFSTCLWRTNQCFKLAPRLKRPVDEKNVTWGLALVDQTSRAWSICCKADAHYSCLLGHSAEGEWLQLAPLRMLSLHLRTVGPEGFSWELVQRGGGIEMPG